jgi:endonuclease-8
MNDALAGRPLTRSEFRVPRYATVDLVGRTVLEVVSRGKHLLTRIDGDLTLHTHFRMEGSWRLFRPGQKWTGGAGHTIRVVLGNAEWTAVGYRMPVVDLVPTSEEGQVVGHLGPDVLGPDWDPQIALANLRGRPDEEIGVALLDQRNLAGLGNIYRCEVCFLCGVSPWTRVRDVPDLERMIELSHKLLWVNRDRPEQSTTGDLRRDRSTWVVGRGRRPCRRCGAPIRMVEQGTPPQQRITYWCPRCQPLLEAR